MNLLNARHFGKVGFGYWILPCIILLTGLYVIIRPMDPPAIAMLILGWCTLLYGVTELINAIKIHNEKRKFAKAQEIPVAEEVKEDMGNPTMKEEEGKPISELPASTSETEVNAEPWPEE